MNSSLYIGATGMKGLAEGMNVVAHNMSNANTVGFKQQNMLFEEMISTQQGGMGNWWGAQESSYVAMGQTGKGLKVDTVRTIFKQGGYESSNTATDMSITGKGFFEVTTPNGDIRYTRAGNFRFNKDGVLQLPDGSALTGYTFDTEGNRSGPGPIQVQPGATLPPKATSAINLQVNLGDLEDKSSDVNDPYFAMVKHWQTGAKPGLERGQSAYAQGMRVYDAKGTPQVVTFYADGAPENINGTRTLEFMLGANGADAATGGDIPLMSGTLTFDGGGNLIDISAFVPTDTATPNDLSTWVPATFKDGLPQFTLNGSPVTFNLGLTATAPQGNVPANAAAVGTNMQNLPTVGQNFTTVANASTGFDGSSVQKNFVQDGYSEGQLANLQINDSGQGIGSYSNGQKAVLFEIPICRFTSEDGLRREGGNFFSWTADAGQMEMGAPGTENYGNIFAYSLETSNVDIASEMINMIVNQRGFQSNSKVVTTADAMLQKAIELKR